MQALFVKTETLLLQVMVPKPYAELLMKLYHTRQMAGFGPEDHSRRNENPKPSQRFDQENQHQRPQQWLQGVEDRSDLGQAWALPRSAVVYGKTQYLGLAWYGGSVKKTCFLWALSDSEED